ENENQTNLNSQIINKLLQIPTLILHIPLAPHMMLERNLQRHHPANHALLLGHWRIRMCPHRARKVPRRGGQVVPLFSTLPPPVVRRRHAERNGYADDEAERRKQ